MNKKRRVKKSSTVPYDLILRRALLIVVLCAILVALGWLINTAFSGLDVEAADVFAVFMLITMTASTLLLILIAVEKFTGHSWLNGLEFIGEYTLRMIDLGYNKTLDFVGVDNQKTNRRVKKRVNVSNTKLDITHEDRQNTPISPNDLDEAEEIIPSKPVEKDEPSLGFKLSDLKTEEEPSLGAELFQNSFSKLVEQEKSSEVAIKNDTFDKSVSDEVIEISQVDDLLDELLNKESEAVNLEQEGPVLSDVELSRSSIVEPSVVQEDYDDVEDEEKQEEQFNYVGEGYSSNGFEEPGPENSQIESLAESEPPAPKTNNSFSDISKNNLMGLAKKNEEEVAEDEGVFQFSSVSSMLDQAKQAAANIISDLQPVFNSEPQEKSYRLPDISLLEMHEQSIRSYTEEELEDMSRTVERVLLDYKVSVEVQGAYPGPVITRFELALAPGVKVSRVSGLAKDLARAMRVTSVRVVEIIAGTSFVGLEIPNQERELVSFREIIASEAFQNEKSSLTLSLGKDVSGKTVVADLGKMPHVLVAGTTGSGKSVAINTMILSMLFKATPEQVRLIMIDPKMLELSVYEGIPHLLTPVVTDMKEAQSALRWAVAEMERRYKLMSKVGVRNLAGYNQKIDEAAERGETIRDPLFQLTKPLENGEAFPALEKLPHIVIVIDELADMMMIVGKKVEELIARLAQKARAAGVHLILATQRPSVDVLTGLIKANVPTRISFQVSSRIDSRTILDQGGAEALLGNGDMLFLPSGTSIPVRAHGAFVADEEVHQVVEYLKTQGAVNYLTDVIQEDVSESQGGSSAPTDETDPLYNDALDFVYDSNKASISSLQRRFKIGYNRAARMIDQMQEENIVSQPEGNGSRSVIRRD